MIIILLYRLTGGINYTVCNTANHDGSFNKFSYSSLSSSWKSYEDHFYQLGFKNVYYTAPGNSYYINPVILPITLYTPSFSNISVSNDGGISLLGMKFYPAISTYDI